MKQTKLKRWHTSTPVIVLFLILFFPIGLFLMWKYSNWTKRSKWIVSSLFSLFIVFGLVGAYNSPPTISVTAADNSVIHTENSEYVIEGSVSSIKDATLTIDGKEVELSEDYQFSHKIQLSEGDAQVNLVSNNANGTTIESITVHRSTKAELAAKSEAERADISKKNNTESKESTDIKVKDANDSNINTEKKSQHSWRWPTFKWPSFNWPFGKSEDQKAKDKVQQDKIAKEKADAEAAKPLQKFDDFYEWATTTITSQYGYAFGGNQDDYQVRWAYNNSQCRLNQDVDNDGVKDLYYDKSCLQDKYKEYLKPVAFDYGSSKDNGKTDTCSPDLEIYYSHICTRYGDLVSRVEAAKATPAFQPVDDYEEAESIYNEIAKTKRDR